MKRYKVHSRNPRYFDSLDDARAFANEYWHKTGNIVAVTEVPKRGV